MQDGHASRDGAYEDFPRGAMCKLNPERMPAKSSITILVPSPNPIPTVITDGDVGEYSFLKDCITVGHFMMYSTIGG